MRLKIYILLLNLIVIFSCANNKSITTNQLSNALAPDNLYLPGIDSTVVKNAIQFSDKIVVDFDRQNQANRWYTKGMHSFHIADSIWSRSQTEIDNDSINIKMFINWRREHNTDTKNIKILNNIKLAEICIEILNVAETEANRAMKLDPFNLDIRSLLIKIYIKQGEISKASISYTRAIEELNNFLSFDKSNPYIYEKLAECYYALKDWENCYQNFRKAEQVLKIVTELNYDNNEKISSSLDTVRLVYYLRGQGEVKAKLYDSEQAIYYLTCARDITNSEKIKQQLQEFLNWIDWDGGNIRAAELKDDILTMEKIGAYKKAREKYLDLLKILTTQQAENEINWKIASIEYNFLGRKEDALKRLFQVIKNIRESDQNHSLNLIYLNDYAAMCYSIGIECFNQHKFRLAYIYMNQASQFNWEHRGDCYFHMALLSHQNPSETIRLCKNALEYSEQLSKQVLKKIHELLAVSYQRQANFDVAQQYFQKLVNF